jgi:hypothetical protein
MADQIYTHSNIQFFVSALPQVNDLDANTFSGLTWVPVGPVGAVPERGISTNMLTYDTVNTVVAQKAKGITDAGGGTLECARNDGDPGQQLLRTIGAPSYTQAHAYKLVKQDGTIEYGRGLVAGPNYPGGRNEDFDIANFTFAFVQPLVEVSAAAGVDDWDVVVHTGVTHFQLVADGALTGFISSSATYGDVASAIGAVLTGGKTATGVTGTGAVGSPWNVTTSSPITLFGIGANVAEH